MSLKKLISLLVSFFVGGIIFVAGTLLVKSGLLMTIFRDIPSSLCNNLGRIFDLNFSKYYYSKFCREDVYFSLSAFKPLIDIVFRLGTLLIAFYSSVLSFTFTTDFLKKFTEPSYKKFILWSVKYRVKRITKLVILILVMTLFFSIYFPSSVKVEMGSSKLVPGFLGYSSKRYESTYEFSRKDVSCKTSSNSLYPSNKEIRCSAKGVLTDKNEVKSDFAQEDIYCSNKDTWDNRSPVCRAAIKLGILRGAGKLRY